MKDDPLFTSKEAAKYINFEYGTLAVWRCTKRHRIKYSKIGGKIRYRKSELDRFVKEHEFDGH